MSAAPNLLALGDTYRDDSNAHGLVSRRAVRHLETAGDALSLALLTLTGGRDDDRTDKVRRAEQARAFLVEAVTALSRARIYVPGVRTHALPVLMASEANTDAELSRLHQIATRLLWQNHTRLPARLQAKPLAPEEEAQLAVVINNLARNRRIDRALRYKWCGLALGVAAAGPLLGFPLLGAVAASCAVGLAAWRIASRGKDDSSTDPSRG